MERRCPKCKKGTQSPCEICNNCWDYLSGVEVASEKEFNLSEKIIDDHFNTLLKTKDVKEFIRRLKEEWLDAEAVHKTIDKLAGEKLI